MKLNAFLTIENLLQIFRETANMFVSAFIQKTNTIYLDITWRWRKRLNNILQDFKFNETIAWKLLVHPPHFYLIVSSVIQPLYHNYIQSVMLTHNYPFVGTPPAKSSRVKEWGV